MINRKDKLINFLYIIMSINQYTKKNIDSIYYRYINNRYQVVFILFMYFI